MKRRYLITGAQGLVGRQLAAKILEEDAEAEVLGTGRSSRNDSVFTHSISLGGEPRRAKVPVSLLGSLDRRYRYEQAPLLDGTGLRQALREFRPDCVFHLASALHAAPERELFETNVEGTVSLMDALADAGGPLPLFVLGSSGSVYGRAASLPIAEGDACNPAEMYGMTKLAAEHVTRIKASRSGVPFVVARIFNVVGPGQSDGHVCGRLAAQLASIPRRPGAVLTVGALDTTRDFIDVRDVAAALLLLARHGAHGTAYNVASGRETPIHAVLSELLRIAGRAGEVEIVRHDDRPAGVPRHVADISRLRQLGFAPSRSLAASLEDLFRYCQTL